MVPNTALLLELNRMQMNSSKMAVKLWVAETINKSTDTTHKSAHLSMKSIQIPVVPIKPNEDVVHH